MRLLVGKAAARARPAALLLCAKGGTHARRGIRSGSKLIESLDMAQTPLESGGDSNHVRPQGVNAPPRMSEGSHVERRGEVVTVAAEARP
jgi:hypothetical protein